MFKKLLILSILIHLIAFFAFAYLVNSLGGISYMLFKMKHRGVTGVYQHRVQLFENMKLNDTDIVFLGNSITEQGAWTELLENPKVKNRGIAGDMTEGILERLHTITEAQPAQIFLMIGVNDLISYRPKQIALNYRKIVRRIQEESPNSKLIVQSILPVNNQVKNTGIANEDIKALNILIQEITSEFGIQYLNLQKLFKDEQGNLKEEFTYDGIHINGTAYLLWKESLKEWLLDE